jgi:hypothetical protein
MDDGATRDEREALRQAEYNGAWELALNDYEIRADVAARLKDGQQNGDEGIDT